MSLTAEQIQNLVAEIDKNERGLHRPVLNRLPWTNTTRIREELQNKDLEQDIKLKRLTLIVLLCFLGVETALIFILSFLQAGGVFKLEEWNFRLLISATIIQISYILKMAICYLFPKK